MKTVKWTFIVFCIFLGSLFFRDQSIPADWVVSAVSSRVPTNVVFKCDSASFGFRRGARVRGVRVFDKERANPVESVLSADSASVDFFLRRVRIVGLRIHRLHDGYYLPGNSERNGRLDAEFPNIPSFSLTLVRPSLLLGKHKDKRFGEELMQKIFGAHPEFLPAHFRPVRAETVAAHLVANLLKPPVDHICATDCIKGKRIIYNRQLREL